MPTVELKTPVRFGGRWYRPGREVEVPAELAVELNPKQAQESDAVPEDFPGREALAAGGYTSLSAIRAAKDADLDKVTGIGPATLREIRGALK